MSDEMIQRAMTARLHGDNPTAITICRQLLDQNDDNMQAISLLGVSLAEVGAIEDARPLVERAVAAEPANWRFILNQSILLECEGDIHSACAAAERAAEAGPDRFETWGRLGDLAGRLENYQRATEALAKAVEINPNMPALAMRLGAAAYELGDFDRAISALDLFEESFPGHPQALKLRTYIARKRCDWEGLIEAAKKSMAASPNDEAPRVALAFAQAQLGHFRDAVKLYRPLADAQPPKAFHLATMGKYLLSMRALEEAAVYYRRALELDPTHSPAAAGYARYHIFHGNFEEAAKYARLAIQLDPSNSEAFAELSIATGSKLADNEIEILKEVGEDKRNGLKHRAIAWFTCGDAYHARKDRPAAFKAWMRANALRRDLSEDGDALYDAAKHEDYVRWIMSSLPAQRSSPYQSPVKGPVPIFIVGMPRSGTTLLENAISSHSRASSGGELPYMVFALSELASWADLINWKGGDIPEPMIDAYRKKYYEQYEQYDVKPAEFVTDKLPNNFLAVGLIRQVFPEAKIIHIRRSPVEVGFSMYRRNFSRGWMFATDLDEIAHYYAEYSKLTEHWFNIMQSNFAFIQYEELVRNFERELRRLLDFCGLEFDQKCLEYYKQDRTVVTFSAAQVRKPPSPEHLDSTTPYQEFLGPLRDGLQGRGVNLETGAMLQR